MKKIKEIIKPEELEKLDEEIMPEYGSHPWSDYIKGQFEEDELINGHPKVDGLRRLVEEHLGPITHLQFKTIQGPSDQNGYTAVVECHVGLHNKQIELDVISSDVAEANNENLSDMVSIYKTQCAATRAEARVYRKLLRLYNVVSADELKNPFEEQGDKASANQVTLIEKMCEELHINMSKLCNLKKLTKPKAQDLIGQLLSYKKDSNLIPPNVRN